MNNEYSSFKVVDLKRELKGMGLKTTGSKEELVERLITYKTKLLGSSADIEHLNENIIESDILDEEAVLGDELDDAEEDEVLKKVPDDRTNLSDTTNSDNTAISFPNTPQSTNNLSTPASETHKEEAKRKFVLVRKTSIPLLGGYDKENEKTETTDEHKHEDKMEEGEEDGELNTKTETESKVTKVATLSMNERLSLRTKRFGVQSDEARKTARAARFGINDSISQGGTVDVLKKRAERFGAIVSPVLSKKEFENKMAARRARFGLPNSSNQSTDEEKKKLRAQRFNS